MKKILMTGMLVLLIVSFCATDTLAKHRGSRPYQSPDNFVTFSCFIQPLSFGLKHQVVRNVFLTGNMDYLRADEDLLFQAGAAYMIPRKILFFRLYGGGGLEMSRNRGVMYPYLMAGTKFWFLFAEIYHPLEKERTPGYRFGFCVSF
jgi:hypothetical protein